MIWERPTDRPTDRPVFVVNKKLITSSFVHPNCLFVLALLSSLLLRRREISSSAGKGSPSEETESEVAREPRRPQTRGESIERERGAEASERRAVADDRDASTGVSGERGIEITRRRAL